MRLTSRASRASKAKPHNSGTSHGRTGPATGARIALGNQAHLRNLRAAASRAQSSEPAEREADAAASSILSGGHAPRIRSSAHPEPLDGAAGSELQVSSGGARRLEGDVRHVLQRGFGRNLERVRLHTDAASAASAEALGAAACASGDNVVFGAGRYAPDSPAGLRLLAHEVAHVVQGPGEGGQPVVRRQDKQDAPTDKEAAAELMADVEALKARASKFQAIAFDDPEPVSLAKAIALWPALHEAEDSGLYGPVMQAMIGAGLLDPAPSYIVGKRRKIVWGLEMGRPEWSLAELNGLQMLDMVDVLRQLEVNRQSQIVEAIPSDPAGLGPDSGGRMLAALQTVARSAETVTARVLEGLIASALKQVFGENYKPPSDQLPGDQQAVLKAYSELRSWPERLRGVTRTKQTVIKLQPGAKVTGGAMPLNKPALKDAGDMDPEQLPPDQRTMVELIARNRARLPDRLTDTQISGQGYSYTSHAPEMQAKAPDEAKTGYSPELAQAIRKEIAGEGSTSAILTNDPAIVTWGVGMAHTPGGGGMLEQWVSRFLDRDIEARNLLLDAGVALVPKPGVKNRWTWMVVDTETGVIEQDESALRLMSVDRKLLSLMINIGEDEKPQADGKPSHAEQVAQAQAEAFADKFTVPPDVRGWDIPVIRLCLHAIMWGLKLDWAAFKAAKTGTILSYRAAFEVVVNRILGVPDYYEMKVRSPSGEFAPQAGTPGKRPPSDAIAIVKGQASQGVMPAVTLLSFADGYAVNSKLLTKVADATEPGVYFDQRKFGAQKGLWKLT